MTDISEFDRELQRLIDEAQADLRGINRAHNNVLEVHKQMNNLRGLYDLVERDKQSFVRDFQAKVEALRHEAEQPYGGYNLHDPNDPMPRIMQARDRIRQEYQEQGFYGPEAAE